MIEKNPIRFKKIKIYIDTVPTSRKLRLSCYVRVFHGRTDSLDSSAPSCQWSNYFYGCMRFEIGSFFHCKYNYNPKKHSFR